jgi:uncharacterized membrane protein YoaK (UPF0700 family)
MQYHPASIRAGKHPGPIYLKLWFDLFSGQNDTTVKSQTEEFCLTPLKRGQSCISLHSLYGLPDYGRAWFSFAQTIMISKLPRWVWSWTWALAFVAGIVNVVGLLGFEHHAVTHLTGNTSMLAVAVANLDPAETFHFILVIGSFVAGTVLSGIIIQDSVLQLGRRYGVALLLESLLLFAAVPLLNRSNPCGFYAAACACGLQNAMVSAYSGTVVRTTHLSGMFTDLGIFLGHAIRGLPVDSKRLRLCLLVISGFFCGGVAGSVGFRLLGAATLCIPAMFTGLSGVGYGLYQLKGRQG